MRAHDFFNEDLFGTEPKRPARAGSRPSRGGKSEPRYKSAPVVPGGDNPDAVHVPNKGDEPVQRGDQVVVQDPDNIATVFTGTVKRVGREHVYVTLKNGETIAAPHDEVSKSYEVLSKRAHNILNKKGPSRSKYKVDETSPLGKMGFPDEFISAIYQGSNLQHSEQPVPLEGKPKAADFKDGVVIAKGRDGKMYAVRWADKNYGGRDGAILYTWDHENGATGGKYVTFTQALAPMKAGTEFWKIPLWGYDRGRGNTQVDRARSNNEQLQWETLEYMNRVFLPQLKVRIEQYLDYIYANLRKLKSEKRYSYDSTEQERALSAAKALQDIADKGFNKETVTQFLYANKMGDSGWGSYYRNQENFVELMNTKPAARAEFAKMVFNSAKSLYQSVKDMVQAPSREMFNKQAEFTETKKLTSREKFLRGLKRGGYDVEERSKYWDEKVKELERQRDEYEKELASRKQSNVGEMAAPGAVANKVTRVQGKEYLVHSLPADMSKVKLVTDDSGKQVYIWVEKAGMRPQYTYYWFAPAQPVQESMCAKHISPSGAETTMCPDDDDYEINYGKNSGIDDFRKKNGLDVRTGKKVKEECAGVGIVTKQNSTADVGPGTIKKNLKAFNLEEILSELGVDQTFQFAKKAHGDQMYGDQPYWTHPRAVAAAGKRFFGSKFNNDAIKVAFLHDVVEDTPYKLEQLKNMGLSPEVIEAVELLTKNKALSYEENIKRIIASGNRLAMMVKYADNFKNYTGDKSNFEPSRAERLQKKYGASLDMLGSKLGINKHADRDAHVADMEQELEEWKASRQLCRSSTPDADLGASALASCKSQGLRARDGNKSHKVGNKRITVGGHRIKGKKYGGPLPDYGTRK